MTQAEQAAVAPLTGDQTAFVQVAVIVDDVDRAVEFLTAVGLGPFEVKTGVHPAARIHGEKKAYEAKLAFSMQGQVQLELIQPLTGDNIYKEQRDAWGPSMHHVQVVVDDLDAAMARFEAMGVEVTTYDRFKAGGGIAFVNTQPLGGILIELKQPRTDPNGPPGYVDD